MLGTESTTRGLGSRVHLYSDGLMIQKLMVVPVMLHKIVQLRILAWEKTNILIHSLYPGLEAKKQALYDVEPNQLIEVHENVNEPVSIFKRILNYFND